MAKRSDIVGIAVILLVVCLAVTMYSKSEAANLKSLLLLKMVKYCVVTEDLPKAANLMADVNEK